MHTGDEPPPEGGKAVPCKRATGTTGTWRSASPAFVPVADDRLHLDRGRVLFAGRLFVRLRSGADRDRPARKFPQTAQHHSCSPQRAGQQCRVAAAPAPPEPAALSPVTGPPELRSPVSSIPRTRGGSGAIRRRSTIHRRSRAIPRFGAATSGTSARRSRSGDDPGQASGVRPYDHPHRPTPNIRH